MFILPQFEGERRERESECKREREREEREKKGGREGRIVREKKRMGMAGCTFMVPNFPPRTSTSGKLSLTKGE